MNKNMTGNAVAVAKRAGNRNVGVEKAQAAALKIGAKIVVPPAVGGKPTDANDFARAKGKAALKSVIETTLDNAPLPDGFFYNCKDGGALWAGDPEKPDKSHRVCGHLRVLGRSYGSGGHGFFIEFIDALEKRANTVVLGTEIKRNGGQDLETRLAEAGFYIEDGKRGDFKRFILGFKGTSVVKSVDRVGWLDDDSGVFILPGETFGQCGQRVVFQSSDSVLEQLYTTGGALDAWQRIAELAGGNDILTLAASAPFSAPLISIAGANNFIINLRGNSQKGKTTALKLAASVWGNPENQIRNWNMSNCGMEALAPFFNDNIMLADELGTVRGAIIGNMIYQFVEGTGATRMTSRGNLRAVSQWNGCMLSTGELVFSDMMKAAGQSVKAGQMVRFVSVPMSNGHITDFHGFGSAKDLLAEIALTSSDNYGLAGRCFLRKLVTEYRDLQKSLTGMIRGYSERLAPRGCDNQVSLVASRFALVTIGGELAQRYDILPKSLDVWGASERCFRAWLAERGTAGNLEDKQILDHIKVLLLSGESHFQDLDNNEAYPPLERWGYRKYWRSSDRAFGRTVYIIPRELLGKKLCGDFRTKDVIDVLKKNGWLLYNGKSNQKHFADGEIPGMGQCWLYCVFIPDEQSEAE